MRAQVLHKIAPIERSPLVYESTKDPELLNNRVLIRIKAAGVCHSNLHMIEGEFKKLGVPSKLPIIPGHEIAGVVEEVGRGVKKWEVGQRVGVQVLYETCRTCEYCISGRDQLCLSRQITGETVDGGYAEYIQAPADFIYEMPDNLGDEEAAPLFCPGLTAYRAVKRAGVRFGHKVAVIGIGGVGHMSLQFAKLAGAEVTAIDIMEGQLALAKELGADFSITPDLLDDHLSKNGKPDVVMVHAPSQQAVDQAFKILKRGGTVLMAVLGDVSVFFPEEYTIQTSAIGPRSDMIETLRLASQGKVRVKWKKFRLKEATEVLKRLKKGNIVGRAVLVP